MSKYKKIKKVIAPGTVIEGKRNWIVGNPIGNGGFGVLYTVFDECQNEYCIKIEPVDNGPLFVETRFYIRATQKKDIEKWICDHKLTYLGIPKYETVDQACINRQKCRFLVLQKFDTDLQRYFDKCQNPPIDNIMVNILNALEYIHSRGYVHSDIKASNILLNNKNQKRVYLADYGLAHKYMHDDTGHRPYKRNPKKAHDGTLEFTSIDAHLGVDPSRRDDMEILGYCLIKWLGGTLPWESNLKDKNFVRDSKIEYSQDINQLLCDSFDDVPLPFELASYFAMVFSLGYEEKPDYDKFRSLFGGRTMKTRSDTLKSTSPKCTSPKPKCTSPLVKQTPPRIPTQKCTKPASPRVYPDKQDLNKYTVKQLKLIAKNFNLTGYSRLLKKIW